MGLILRAMSLADLPLLAAWLANPDLLSQYEGRDYRATPEAIQTKFSGRTNAHRGRVTGWIVEERGFAIGYGQTYLWRPQDLENFGLDPMSKRGGFDVFIGLPSLWGQGRGVPIVSRLCELLERKNPDTVLIDPLAHNTRAIACYQKAGFRALKILTHHIVHEGTPTDVLLMTRPVAQTRGALKPSLRADKVPDGHPPSPLDESE